MLGSTICSRAAIPIGCLLLLVTSAAASDLRSWRLLASSAPLPAALGVPMGVYDSLRQRVLVIEASYVNQPLVVHVFESNPEPYWSTLATTGTPPQQIYLASLVYDSARDRLLVIGHGYATGMDVWALPLSGALEWQRLVTSGDPPPRDGQSAIYDPAHDRVVMFGGMGWTYPHPYLSDVRMLRLSTGEWSAPAVGGSALGGREGHGALYDPERRRMLVFGGHYEDAGTRGFWNDCWELSLDDSLAWTEIVTGGPLPGARSAFATTYDPVRRRMLVHGGVNAESGVEPDDLWALSLDGAPTWTPIVTEDTLRGRSYPVDVYDPIGDRLLACGGDGYPQVSVLPLAAPVRWHALLPPSPLPAPGARSDHAVIHDTRRDRFLVVGGGYSSVDSASWAFEPEDEDHWRPLREPAAPVLWFAPEYWQATVYDSLGDRLMLFDGGQVWSRPAAEYAQWTKLGPLAPWAPQVVGSGAAVAIDTRRNRLIVSGGWAPYAHSAGFTLGGVMALSLGADSTWQVLGTLPQPWGSSQHASYYDPVRDRLVIVGGYEVFDSPRSHRDFGAVAWSTPVETTLVWTKLGPASDAALPGPPKACTSFDPRTARLFLARDSTVWAREGDDTATWQLLTFSTERPTITSAIAYDPVRDQLLALFASATGSDRVEAWAVAVGPLAVSLLESSRTADAIALRWRSVAAFGHVVTLERREEGADWSVRSPLAFDVNGIAAYTDHDVRAGHDYYYRVSILDGDPAWHSEPVFVPDPASLRLALFGARPDPAVGTIALAFSLPAGGPARLELFDLHGRRCFSREVGGMGPGMHVVRVEPSTAWRPGVYFARLEWGGETRTRRMVLTR